MIFSVRAAAVSDRQPPCRDVARLPHRRGHSERPEDLVGDVGAVAPARRPARPPSPATPSRGSSTRSGSPASSGSGHRAGAGPRGSSSLLPNVTAPQRSSYASPAAFVSSRRSEMGGASRVGGTSAPSAGRYALRRHVQLEPSLVAKLEHGERGEALRQRGDRGTRCRCRAARRSSDRARRTRAGRPARRRG